MTLPRVGRKGTKGKSGKPGAPGGTGGHGGSGRVLGGEGGPGGAGGAGGVSEGRSWRYTFVLAVIAVAVLSTQMLLLNRRVERNIERVGTILIEQRQAVENAEQTAYDAKEAAKLVAANLKKSLKRQSQQARRIRQLHAVLNEAGVPVPPPRPAAGSSSEPRSTPPPTKPPPRTPPDDPEPPPPTCIPVVGICTERR